MQRHFKPALSPRSMLAPALAGILLSAATHAGDAQSILKSAGPLAFGPKGVLFVGDSQAGAVVAIETADTVGKGTEPMNIVAVDTKIAALLGTTPDQILINDAVVNPLSKRVYFSVSRGQGPEAIPVILRTNPKGELEELAVADLKHAVAVLPNAPTQDAKDRAGRSLRQEAITDLEYVDGHVVIAGLSNEEFSSKLRSIKYPFAAINNGTSVEIYHGSHGRYETNSPVRTFVSYTIDKKPHILAAYTCTPLVKFQLSDLQPGSKVMGTTIAELGARNRPLDMIVYRKGKEDYLLMNNSSRGVMKMSTQGIEGYQPITSRVADTTGLPYETLADVKGVTQLDRWDNATAMMLVKQESGSFDVRPYALP
jgi:hypothetical protein